MLTIQSLRQILVAREPRWTKHVLRPWVVTLWRGLIFSVYNHLVSVLPGYGFRKAYLQTFCGLSIGEGTAVHMGCFVSGPHIRVGDHSVINRRCHLDGRGQIDIGRNVSISPEVYIVTATHLVNDPGFAAVRCAVRIEDYVWIGARAMILPDVTLGTGCVVGAGAVVAKSVAPYQIVVGNPARVIGERSKNLTYQLSHFPFLDTDDVLPDLFSPGGKAPDADGG